MYQPSNLASAVWGSMTLDQVPNTVYFAFPDTYVKMYLRDNDRLLLKRKTAIAKKSCTPEFNQTIKYAVRDVSDRSLVVMLWERQKGFEHNQGLGSAEIRVDTLKLSDHVIGWYPLFPIQKIGSESNDSP